MASPNDVPRVAEPIAGTGGFVTRAWLDFFLKLASSESQADLAALYAALAARVAELEENEGLSFQIIGQGAISVNGLPQPGGFVVISLQNDTDNPGNTMYYGTGPTGVKGWYPISGSIDVTTDLTKVVAGTGVTTLGLADLANSGVGAALVKITRDSKGRISGTQAATTDDLGEGSSNQYFTVERAQDAVGSALVDTPTINLTYDDATGQISADCSLMLWGGATSTAPAAGVKMISNANTQSQFFEVITTGNSVVGPDICSTEYSDVGGGGLFHVRRARGSISSPTAVLAGDIIGGMSGRSYHSGGAFQASGPASLHWVASENQTPTGFGSYMRFYSTPQGSTNRVERLVLTDVGATWSLGAGTFDPKSAAQTQPFGTNTHRFLASAVGEACRITSIGYGVNGSPQVNLAHANGTAASPTAVTSGDQLGLISCIGYTGSAWVSAGLFRYQASENWTPTANGVDFILETVATGSAARTEKLRLWNDGRLSGKALHNNPGAMTGTSDQFIGSGTYTPTLTKITNISASIPDVCQWMRVGNVVTVSGTVQIDVIATGTAQLGMSLPISSAFTLPTQGGGTAASNNETLRIRADAVTPNRVLFEAAIKSDIANAAFYFSFTYQVV